MKPGKVIREFDKNGRKVIFRTPRISDARGATTYINSMVRDRAFIGVQRKKTTEREIRWIRRSLRDIREGRSYIIVVEVDGRFSGEARVSRMLMDSNSHICNIGIGLHREIRGMGIGRELMKTLLELGRDRLKCSIAHLTVFEPNRVAIKLYKEMGFFEAGRIPGGCKHFGKYYDDIIMVKKL